MWDVACPKISTDKLCISRMVIKEILKRKLKINYDLYEKYTYNDEVELEIYINSQREGWKLTQNELEKIYMKFKQRISPTTLQRACHELGYEFYPNPENDWYIFV